MLLLLSSWAFSSGQQDGAVKKSLSVWLQSHFSKKSSEMIRDRFLKFGQENNVGVSVELFDYSDGRARWAVVIESGVSPDIGLMEYDDLGRLAEQGVLLDQSDNFGMVQKENGNLYPSLKSTVTFGGKQWGLPLFLETDVLYYRRDRLADSGYGGAPETWDRLREIAAKTTDAAYGVFGAGIGFGRKNRDGQLFLRSLVWGYGGSLVDAAGKNVAIYSPGTVQAYEWVRQVIVVDRSTPPGSVHWDDEGNDKSFLSGQACMIINGGSILDRLINEDAELLRQTDISPVPSGPRGRFLCGRSSALGIFRDTGVPDLSERMIRYLLSKDWYARWMDTGAPIFAPVYTNLDGRTVWDDPLKKPIVKSSEFAFFLGYPAEYTRRAGEAYERHIFSDAAERLVLDHIKAEEAVAELEAAAREIFGH
ncbi:MAG TPA: extracellular solute-binding protein [Spirochaetia bacterium]|nr:extracellular solute-binding protein [Spirochaetia bacterium]